MVSSPRRHPLTPATSAVSVRVWRAANPPPPAFVAPVAGVHPPPSATALS
ncbi:MAG: hypothetical protein LCH89_14760 [Proteobacteria bacterium]|nr:hypothetical protein [Pseudomonadota bacterium]